MQLLGSGDFGMTGWLVVGDSVCPQVTEHHLCERIWTCLLSGCTAILK